MRKIDLFAKNELSEQDTDDLLREMLQKTLTQQQKEHWVHQLETQYGVLRNTSNTQLSARRIGTVWRWAAAIALILTAAAGLWHWFPQDNYQQLADRVIETEKIGYTDLRKGAVDAVNIRLQAAEAYQRGDYAVSIRYWQTMQTMPFFTADDQFYLALSYLYNGDYERAYQALERHAGLLRPGGRFEAESTFFKAVVLLKLDRVSEAQQILTTLQSTTSSAAMQRKTTDLLNALKKQADN